MLRPSALALPLALAAAACGQEAEAPAEPTTVEQVTAAPEVTLEPARAQLDAATRATTREEALRLLAEAERLANEALVANRTDPQAQLVKARALLLRGLLGGSSSDLTAARDLLVSITNSSPQLAEAWATLGRWHGEIITRETPAVAQTLGASRAGMDQAFVRARALGTSGETLASHGLLLMRLGDLEGARAHFEEAAGAPQAAQGLRLIAAGDAEAARQYALEQAPFAEVRASTDLQGQPSPGN